MESSCSNIPLYLLLPGVLGVCAAVAISACVQTADSELQCQVDPVFSWSSFPHFLVHMDGRYPFNEPLMSSGMYKIKLTHARS